MRVNRKPRLALAALIVCAAAGSLRAENGLESRASWQQPAEEAVQAAVEAWLADWETDRQVDEADRARIAEIWAEDTEEHARADRLERLVATFAVLDEGAREVLEFCESPQRPRTLPPFTALDDPQRPAVVRYHLRLHLARWLAQHRLYDECLEQIGQLEPEQVLDPASLLFYQAVAHHRLLDKDRCLLRLGQLLENRAQLPRRYATVALLMEADIRPLTPDSLDEVSRMMDNIERRLALGRAGKRVRDEEDEVIEKLDKMIEELEQQLQQAQSAAAGDGGSSGQPMPDSMPAGGSGPGEVERREVGSRAAWGNLPPQQRQEALQQLGKGLPSHYREVIEQYFRKLAQDGSP